MWLLIAILSYFFFALASLLERYLLIGSLPQPKVFTFYVGILSFLFCFVLIFFIPSLPEINLILLGILAGIVRTTGLFFLFKGIFEIEVSRVVPAMGGLVPIFSFFLFFSFFPGEEILNLSQFIAFILLIFGSVLISLKEFSLKYLSLTNLKYPTLAALFFALTFLLTKIVFLETPFLSGLFLLILGSGLGGMFFLIFKETRKLIFFQKPDLKTINVFVLSQSFGGLGLISQLLAVFLAQPFEVPLINALEGTRYLFLLFFVFLLANSRPAILKEEMKGRVLFQKILAVLLIGVGLFLLTF